VGDYEKYVKNFVTNFDLREFHNDVMTFDYLGLIMNKLCEYYLLFEFLFLGNILLRGKKFYNNFLIIKLFITIIYGFIGNFAVINCVFCENLFKKFVVINSCND